MEALTKLTWPSCEEMYVNAVARQLGNMAAKFKVANHQD